MSRDILLVTTREGGATDIQWVEVQDAAECLQCIGQPRQLNSPAPNVKSAKVARPGPSSALASQVTRNRYFTSSLSPCVNWGYTDYVSAS